MKDLNNYKKQKSVHTTKCKSTPSTVPHLKPCTTQRFLTHIPNNKQLLNKFNQTSKHINHPLNSVLRRTDTSRDLAAIFVSEGKHFFLISCSFSCTSIHFQKGVYSIRKEFAPFGSKVFPN